MDKADMQAAAGYFADAFKKSGEQETREPSLWWRRAGHPLFVVVLGGILATAVGTWLQHQRYAAQQKLIKQQQFQDKRYHLLAEFSTPFRRYMVVLTNLRYMQEFFQCMEVPQCRDERQGKDFLGRGLPEVRSQYARFVDEYLKMQSAEAVLGSVRALFGSQQVHAVLDRLQERLLALQEKERMTRQEIRAAGKDIEQLLQLLSNAMRAEVQAADRF